jgi:preprotein translocase SecE subunit
MTSVDPVEPTVAGASEGPVLSVAAVRGELARVTWPSVGAVARRTGIVLGFLGVLSGFVLGCDVIVEVAVRAVTG